MTGNNDIEDVIVGMEAGADDDIRKPFNPGEVKVRVRAGERVINLQSKETVIFALAKLAESRDEDTGNHLERVRSIIFEGRGNHFDPMVVDAFLTCEKQFIEVCEHYR